MAAVSVEHWEGRPGPAPAPQSNLWVFTLDIEKPLNGKETCAPSLHSHASRRPQAPHSAAFVQGPECKTGVADCRRVHF